MDGPLRFVPGNGFGKPDDWRVVVNAFCVLCPPCRQEPWWFSEAQIAERSDGDAALQNLGTYALGGLEKAMSMNQTLLVARLSSFVQIQAGRLDATSDLPQNERIYWERNLGKMRLRVGMKRSVLTNAPLFSVAPTT